MTKFEIFFKTGKISDYLAYVEEKKHGDCKDERNSNKDS